MSPFASSEDLPCGWATARIGEVAEINPRYFEVEPLDEELVSFVPMAAVEAGTGGMVLSEVRNWSDVKRGYTRFQNGDIVFAKITPCMENGKIAIASHLKDGRAAGSTEFHVIRTASGMNARFLLLYLLQEQVRRDARAKMKGAAGQLRVPVEFLGELQLLLPPQPEQDRIVQVAEAHMSRLDASVDALSRVRINLKRYRAAVLKSACEGRLVTLESDLAKRDGRDYEPADNLLTRILTERRVRWEADQMAKFRAAGKLPKNGTWKQKYREPVISDPKRNSDLPEGWAWATVDQLSELVEYGSSAKTGGDQEGVPVLRMGNIVDGELVFDELKYLPHTHPEFPRLLLQSGDVLFNRTNSPELVGKTAVFMGESSTCSFASYLIRVRLLPGVQPQYLSYFINSPLGRAWVSTVVTQQVGQANVNGTKLKELAIPLPPAEEQKRIVAEVDRALSLAKNANATVKIDLARAGRLRQSILKRAFEGNLVPQDPNDEPASALLERIRTSRAEQAKTTSKPKQPRRTAAAAD